MPLRFPSWLVELAARDEPPTEIDDGLLAHFERVGVERFVPVAGSAVLSLDEAVSADSIGGVVPGVPYAEPLGEESAPVAAALARLVEFLDTFDRLRRIRFAAIDMRLAEGAALALLDRDGPARLYDRIIETGLVVTYSRPYLDSNTDGGVGGRWRPPAGPDRDFHQRVIDELRDPYHAHADRTARRTLVNTAELIGREGPPIFAEQWSRLSDEDLTRLADLAGSQAELFEAEARRLGAELGEERRSREP